jgi:eukaryotic translation initiation factor 2C
VEIDDHRFRVDLSSFRINAKVGGVNFCPIDASLKQCESCPTMIVGRYNPFYRLEHRLSSRVSGADVGHASPGVHRPSLASVVFSVDQKFSRYQALARLQQGRVEAIADLKEMMMVGSNVPSPFAAHSVP